MNKIEEKKIHEEVLEKNDLMEWGKNFWPRLKRGEIVGKRFVLLAVAIGAAIGLWLYLSRGAKTSDVAAWRALESTGTVETLDDFAKVAPDSIASKAARLQKARLLLGPQGVNLLSQINPDTRGKAIKSIEEAREIFTKLIDDFKSDLTLQAQSLDGAAQAELALVGIPKEGSTALNDFRGSVDKTVELLERYVKLVGEENAAGKAAKLKAADLKANRDTVVSVEALLNDKMTPTAGTAPKAPPSLTPPPVAPTPPVVVPNLPTPVIPEVPKK